MVTVAVTVCDLVNNNLGNTNRKNFINFFRFSFFAIFVGGFFVFYFLSFKRVAVSFLSLVFAVKYNKEITWLYKEIKDNYLKNQKILIDFTIEKSKYLYAKENAFFS